MTWKPYIGGHVGAPMATEMVAMLAYEPDKLVLVATADGSHHGDHEANARLIAAAPEMAENLQRALKLARFMFDLWATRLAGAKLRRELEAELVELEREVSR